MSGEPAGPSDLGGRPSAEPDGVAVLRVSGRDVAHYNWAPRLPLAVSPRPYLHPVRTLAGCAVTGAQPAGYPHHLGISVAVENVAGQNFWGGRSYVPGRGPTWLDNHGRQRHEQWLRRTPTELHHTLRWTDVHEATLLREERSIECRPVDETAWALAVGTRLCNATDHPLTLRSPASYGRIGAGFGGVFWQGPVASAPARVFSPAGTDYAAIHGHTADWLAVTPRDETETWSMVFLAGDEDTADDKWFVRFRHYVGIGSSLSWETPLVLAPGESITRRVSAVVMDGIVSAERAAGLAGVIRAGA
ncbi:MAG TPA: PmoA family protein [Actinoplanes sp.]